MSIGTSDKNYCPILEDCLQTFQEIMLDVLQRRVLFCGFEKCLISKDPERFKDNDFVSFYEYDYFRSQLTDLRKFFDKDSRVYKISFITDHVVEKEIKEKHTELFSTWKLNFEDLANKFFFHKEKGYKPPPDIKKKEIDDFIDELNVFLNSMFEQLTSEGYEVKNSDNSNYLINQEQEFDDFIKIICDRSDS